MLASSEEASPSVKKRRRRAGATLADKKVPQRKKARKSKRAGPATDASPVPTRQDAVTITPLNIPYGNKEIAMKLGARYSAGGWYAPPGVALSPFKEKGWL
jgi:DNA topoisomerase-3